MTARLFRVRLALLFAALALFTVPETACSRVMLISSYDEQVDQAATTLQKRMDGFLTMLAEKAGTPAAGYEANRSFYSDYAVELRSLAIRAGSWPKNELTVRQLTLMTANLEELRKAHESAPLSPEAVPTFRDLFNQGWGAIIALEVAKKRGE
jgi:hypothetical protein